MRSALISPQRVQRTLPQYEKKTSFLRRTSRLHHAAIMLINFHPQTQQALPLSSLLKNRWSTISSGCSKDIQTRHHAQRLPR